MRTEQIKASTWAEAIDQAPWAMSLVPVEGGFMAFANDHQATEFRALRHHVKQTDREREECMRHMNAEFGATLTTEQIQVGIAMWFERARRERAAAAKASEFARRIADRTGEAVLPEHQA